MKKITNTSSIFGLDLRSLALFRIGLALVLIADLINRATDLKAHYTDWGVLPRSVLTGQFLETWHISFHLMNGAWQVQAFLFILHGIFALLLLIGYRTRIVLFLSWLFLISLHSRNPMILQGGDVLFRVLMFWGLFLPLGSCYSVDRALATNAEEIPKRILSVGSVALILQICFVYWFTAILKWHPIWTQDWSAVYYALQIDQFVTPFGKWLRNFPELLKAVTISTLTWEIIGPALLCVPLLQERIRTLVVFLFVGFHVFALGLAMELGLFIYIAAVAWVALLPGLFWEKLFSFSKSPAKTNLKIYYDGECGFCKKLVLILKTFFLFPEVEAQAAQRDPKIFAEMQKRNSWIVVTPDGIYHDQFDAFLQIIKASPIVGFLSGIFSLRSVRWVGNRIYRFVANRRVGFSFLTKHLIYRPASFRLSKVGQVLAAIFLLYVFLWNIRTLDFERYKTYFPRKYNWFGQIFRLDQYWNMFSPYPLKNDGWYVISGKLKNNKVVDVLKGTEGVNWQKPGSGTEFYPNQRWRKYMMNLSQKKYKKHLLYFGKYLCRDWNSRHLREEQLNTFKIYFFLERTQENQIAPIKKRMLWQHYCFHKSGL